jgi:hypothetical protein
MINLKGCIAQGCNLMDINLLSIDIFLYMIVPPNHQPDLTRLSLSYSQNEIGIQISGGSHQNHHLLPFHF